ncbi:uncharacterized protein LOC106669497 [Cimex lectularius]|uniref:Uncharacterized protein n=1 Tax=Cimex lectularius TaxID=79782 RepID=A0A8I6S717_CIMLE|nr:uncharacterized protein LOC106669497 [Cimex lectularius]
MLSRFVLFLGLACLVVRATFVPEAPARNVCADCNGVMRDFTSVEAMHEFNSHNDEYCDVQHSGSCSTVVPCFCTRQYEPRCAWNDRKFKNFTNECEMRRFNYQYYDRYAAVSNCLCHPDANKDLF